MQKTTFTYANEIFEIMYDSKDSTGLGCIKEIVNNNEYDLENFRNIENGVFMDIGANLGVATIIMAKLNPKSTIYAFEPFSNSYNLLIENIKLNNLDNVKPFKLAVSGVKGIQLELTVLNQMSGANSIYANHDNFKQFYTSHGFNENETKKEIVNCITLDEIIDNNNIEQIDLLKIDCEGAEFDIIYKSLYFPNKIVKNMVGEFHDLHYNSIINKSDELVEYSKKYIDGIVSIKILKL